MSDESTDGSSSDTSGSGTDSDTPTFEGELLGDADPDHTNTSDDE